MSIQESCSYHDCEARQQYGALPSNTPSGPRFRCIQCKQSIYCSKLCQQGHWKKHRKVCRAWSELNQVVQSLPLEEAHRRFQQAQQAIREIESHSKKMSSPKVTSKLMVETGADTNDNPSPDTVPLQLESPSKDGSLPDIVPIQEGPTKEPPGASTNSFLDITLDPSWRGTLEVMIHLNSYQITLDQLSNSLLSSSDSLRPPSPKLSLDYPDVDITSVPIDGDEQSSMLILTVGAILCWKLPIKVQEYSFSKLSDCLSIRLRCYGMDDDFFVPTVTPPITPRIDQLFCRSCKSPLLSNPVDRIVPLPSGYWQDISDYLICYSGEPAVHFGSTTNTVPYGMIWEDPSVWVINPDLVMGTVEPLSTVDLYGTLTTTSSLQTSSWKPQELQSQLQQQVSAELDELLDNNDLAVVEQLCCSYCCYPLGLSNFEGYHLYQHRLMEIAHQNEHQPAQPETTNIAVDDTTTSSHIHRRSTSIFIAQELKRYAESQAIFTFIVTAKQGIQNVSQSRVKQFEATATSSTTFHTKASGSLSLLLHVVSWDSILVDLSAATKVPKRVLKVIYEVSSNVPTATSKWDNRDQGQDVLSSWTWGGLDLCCDPRMEGAMTASQPDKMRLNYVHLVVDSDEFEELVNSVTRCPYLFPQDVVDATIRLKLGMNEVTSNTGMAGIELF